MLQIKSLFKSYKNQLLFLVVFIILCVIYFFLNPSTSSYFPKCPLKSISGYECAGCGAQRAFHELLHLRISKAFKCNPLFVASIPFLFFVLLINSTRNETLKTTVNHYVFSKKNIALLLIIVFVFSLFRNSDYYKTIIGFL